MIRSFTVGQELEQFTVLHDCCI